MDLGVNKISKGDERVNCLIYLFGVLKKKDQ